ncbi:MAG TPA: flagellar basal body-associated FliL family protein [Burkholderiaceae bacterium]|jgi:flagellar basal body-associated protein FliL
MAKRSEKEYFVAFTVLTVLALLLAGFYFAWITTQGQSPVAYAKFNAIVVTNQNYSIKTDISVQVSSENEAWLKKNKAPIENILRNSLADVDPKIATGPNGLQALQESLKNAANSVLNTNRIQNVFFTDFLLVPNDSQ